MAKSGWGVDLSVPLGAGIGFYLEDGKQSEIIKSDAGFDAGFLFHIGYRFDINKDFSISVLGELGYNHDEFSYYRISTDKKNENGYAKSSWL